MASSSSSSASALTSPSCTLLRHPPANYITPFRSLSDTPRRIKTLLLRSKLKSSAGFRKPPLSWWSITKAQALDFSGTFFEGGFGGEDDPTNPTGPGSILSAVVDKEERQCPPGLRQYETMAVLRPDMSEDERLSLTQKYEELLVAGGGMYVEVFNRGVIPLAYSIKKKNKAGETNTYLDGIYLLFTYYTKPESIAVLETTLKADDDVIRSSSFKMRKRNY